MLNNLTLLRHLLSYIVVIGHTIELMGYTHLMPVARVLSPNFAVHAFFILSGVVVFLSWQRRPDLKSFFRKRLLRLFPGYIATVIISGIVIWLLTSDQPIKELWQYYAANLSLMNFLHPGISGAFSDNPVVAINGALWTIKVEVMFYIAVPLIGLVISYLKFWPTTILMALFGLAWPMLITWAGQHLQITMPEQVSYQLPGQLHFFGLGILLGMIHHTQNNDAGIFVWQAILATGLWLLMASAFGDWSAFTHLAIGALLVICLPMLPVLAPIVERNDISYGIYLIHFPVIQTVMAVTGNAMPFVLALLLVTSITFALAWLLHVCIEKPAINFGPKRTSSSTKLGKTIS